MSNEDADKLILDTVTEPMTYAAIYRKVLGAGHGNGREFNQFVHGRVKALVDDGHLICDGPEESSRTYRKPS